MKIPGQNQSEKRNFQGIENHSLQVIDTKKKKKFFHTVEIQSRNYPTNSLNGDPEEGGVHRRLARFQRFATILSRDRSPSPLFLSP